MVTAIYALYSHFFRRKVHLCLRVFQKPQLSSDGAVFIAISPSIDIHLLGNMQISPILSRFSKCIITLRPPLMVLQLATVNLWSLKIAHCYKIIKLFFSSRTMGPTFQGKFQKFSMLLLCGGTMVTRKMCWKISRRSCILKCYRFFNIFSFSSRRALVVRLFNYLKLFVLKYGKTQTVYNFMNIWFLLGKSCLHTIFCPIILNINVGIRIFSQLRTIRYFIEKKSWELYLSNYQIDW